MTRLTPEQIIEILVALGYTVTRDVYEDHWRLVESNGDISYDGDNPCTASTEELAWHLKRPDTDLHITMIEIPAWLKEKIPGFRGIRIIQAIDDENWMAEIAVYDIRHPFFQGEDKHPAAAIASAFHQYLQSLKS